MCRKTFGAVLTALAVGYAGASFGYSALVPLANPFTVARVYSDASGDTQFVELAPLTGNGSPDEQSMPRLMVTNRYGVTKQLTLTIPGMRTRSAGVIIASQSLAASLPPGFADAVMPDQFLPTDGGTIAFGGSDRWSYETLPVDGSSLLRDGTVADALLHNARGEYGYAGRGSHVIYEFYNAALDHYFMSGAQPDIDALDSGRIPGWSRTGQRILAPTEWRAQGPDIHVDPIELVPPPVATHQGPDVRLDPIERNPPTLRQRTAGGQAPAVPPAGPPEWTPAGALPVCRFLLSTGSHFFSASAGECDVVAKNLGGTVLETSDAFLAWLPLAASGECPQLPEGAFDMQLIPVYRLWNGRADSNHRYTTDPATRDAMLQAGWRAEGYGNEGVAMCVPSSPL